MVEKNRSKNDLGEIRELTNSVLEGIKKFKNNLKVGENSINYNELFNKIYKELKGNSRLVLDAIKQVINELQKEENIENLNKIIIDICEKLKTKNINIDK